MLAYGFYITVPDLSDEKLLAFVASNMMPVKELLRRARLAKVPEECACCGMKLTDICERFATVPAKGNTLLDLSPDAPSQIRMMALAPAGDHLKIKKGLCRIVYGHLCRQLGRQGYKFRKWVDD